MLDKEQDIQANGARGSTVSRTNSLMSSASGESRGCDFFDTR